MYGIQKGDLGGGGGACIAQQYCYDTAICNSVGNEDVWDTKRTIDSCTKASK